MKHLLLSRFNVKVDIIKRKEIRGEVISAHRVRDALKNKDWKLISELCPKTTVDILSEISV